MNNPHYPLPPRDASLITTEVFVSVSLVNFGVFLAALIDPED
ncbi:hypothetical protein [Acinetobacter sp. 226-4]|nr:hypothetical protein [Acinetobacter sp. 226-4]